MSLPPVSPLSPKRVEQLAAELAPRSDRDVKAAIQDYPSEDRLALKLAITQVRRDRGLTAQAEAETPRAHPFEQPGSYALRRVGVHGPVDPNTLDARLQAAGLPPEVRLAAKIEAEQRGWVTAGLGARVPDDPPPLSLEMATLYQRAGLDPEGRYTPEALEEALDRAEFSPTQRIALKTECHQRHQVHAAAAESWHDRAMALQDRLQRVRQLVRG